MQVEIKEQSSYEKKLIQLETLLNIEIPTSGVLLTIWWIIPGSILYLIFASAIILLPLFTIGLAVLLFQLRKYGWFSVLILFVVVPLCLTPFFSDGSPTYPIYYVYPLGFFALYSITLRMAMTSWDE